MSPRPQLRLLPPPADEQVAPASDPQPEQDPIVRARPSGSGPGALSDATLVAGVIAGDVAAAEQLYRRHAAFALNLAVRIAGSGAEAEDVVHDAFLRAFEKASELRSPGAFRTWLGSIVVHAVRSRLRREKLRRLFGLGAAGERGAIDLDAVASPSASPATRAELAQLYALLGTLPVADRIAWTLRCVEGHELSEAASLAGCSLSTVKRRIARAQRYIDQHFVGADGAQEEP